MQCPDCQSVIPADSAFCPKCGAKLGAVVSKPAPASGMEKFKQKVADTRSAEPEAEQRLWTGSYSPKAMVGNWILATVVTVASIAGGIFVPPAGIFVAVVVSLSLWLGMLGYLWFQRWSVDYELTTQRFVHRLGFFSRLTNRIEVIDIDDVQVIQGFVERMMGVGTIKILSSDTSDPLLILRGIDDVQRVGTLIDNARRDERRRRGLFMEAI